MERYVSVLNPGGKLMLSGFYRTDLDAIKEKAGNLGLTNTGFLEKNNWVACTFKK
jgi:ribosomal protein L11 methyltransferase